MEEIIRNATFVCAIYIWDFGDKSTIIVAQRKENSTIACLMNPMCWQDQQKIYRCKESVK